MIYAVICVTAPRQPLPGDAFRERSIRPFHLDEWTFNVKGQWGEMRMMLSDEGLEQFGHKMVKNGLIAPPIFYFHQSEHTRSLWSHS